MGSHLTNCMEVIENKELEYDMIKDKLDLGIQHVEDPDNIHTIK